MAASPSLAVAGELLAGNGPGCVDKSAAAKFAALSDTDPAYIGIWADGMKDGTCRGYSEGQAVIVEDRAPALACVRAPEDSRCFWVREDMAPR